MPAERTPEDIRKLIVQRYTTAAARTDEVARGSGPPAPLDLATLDLTDESGRALLLDDVAPGTLANVAGYAETDLAGVPDGARTGSFGCATPVSLAELQPGDTVLDLGCGQGLDLILAARAVGPAGRAIGIDLTQAQLDRAQRHIAEAGLDNVELRVGPMEALPLDRGTVDWVISNGAINYSPEKAAVFAEAWRVLRPGGQLLVADVLVEDLDPALGHRLFGYIHNAGATGEAEYLSLIREAEFREAAVVARTEFTARQMLQFIGYAEDAANAAAGPVGQVLSMLEGKIATTAIHARKPA